jgi:flagellar hook-basal body complex protein FliE
MTIHSIHAVDAASTGSLIADRAAQSGPIHGSGGGFLQMITTGFDQVDKKVAQADAMTKAFALDDSIPVHQVTYALEQARLSFELMMQVRSQLMSTFQEFQRMQV